MTPLAAASGSSVPKRNRIDSRLPTNSVSVTNQTRPCTIPLSGARTTRQVAPSHTCRRPPLIIRLDAVFPSSRRPPHFARDHARGPSRRARQRRYGRRPCAPRGQDAGYIHHSLHEPSGLLSVRQAFAALWGRRVASPLTVHQASVALVVASFCEYRANPPALVCARLLSEQGKPITALVGASLLSVQGKAIVALVGPSLLSVQGKPITALVGASLLSVQDKPITALVGASLLPVQGKAIVALAGASHFVRVSIVALVDARLVVRESIVALVGFF